MELTASNIEDFGIAQIGNTEIQDALAEYVKQKFQEASDHRRNIGIDGRLLRNLRAAKCEYQPDELPLLEPYNNVYMGISALKARAAESWLNDIILNNIEKPWTLDPTPQPDLSDERKEELVELLVREIPGLQSTEALRDRAAELKSAANEISLDESRKASSRMEIVINDQMTEGAWVEQYAKLVSDITVYPTTFNRAPIVVQKAQARWDGNTFAAHTKAVPVTRVISPFDAYPCANASTTQDGDGFMERARYSGADLYNLIGLDGFNSGNVRQCLNEYPDGYSIDAMRDAERERLEDQDQNFAKEEKGRYDTVIFNGVVRGELLAEHGVLISDTQKFYECEVWLLGDYVIRAILNPNPTGKRPVNSTSYRKIPGSIWGQSVIDLTYDVNRVCNAAARNLVKNMGYSSGPIGEVASDRVEGTQDPTDIAPYVIKLVGPDSSGTGAKAYNFHQIKMVAPALMDVFNQYLKYADDLSGVPSYVLGNPQVAGAGRTLGGLSMLMGNAAKGIKNVQLNIDRDIIAPTVEGFFTYNMLTSKDKSIKADAKVVARGATGLLQRELAQTRTIEILQLLTPYVQSGAIDQQGLSVLLREILKTTGLPIDDIIADPKKQEKAMDIMKLLGQGGQGGQNPQATELTQGTSTPTPLPPQSLPQNLPALSARPMPVNMATGA